MDINFDDLKKEFDALKAAKNIHEDTCEIGCETQEDSVGFIETIQKYMLAPVMCGIYFSRLDIKVIGLMIDEDVQIRERKRMLRDILRSITNKEQMQAFVNATKKVAQEKINIYDELSQAFTHTKPIFEAKKQAYNKFCKVLEKIVKDFEEAEV